MTIQRIEVRRLAGRPDPQGEAVVREAQACGVAPAPERVDVASVYLIDGLDEADARRVAEDLLADAVIEEAVIGASAPRAGALVEVHPLPGVMDPAAHAVERAIRAMLDVDVRVRTGRRYDMHGTDADSAREIAERCLANGVIHAIHQTPFHPDAFPVAAPHPMTMPEVPIRDLSDDELMELSRRGHLFLDLDEMRAIQAEYRTLGREPREIELETLAQTWSEHCVHKTLKATIEYRETSTDPVLDTQQLAERDGHSAQGEGVVVIDNLLKSTIAAATHELMSDGIDWCLSVFVDNAGIIAFDDEHAVCFKAETHNHPSAIEPYGGAATGIGGCIRDVIGTGLAAKPIAATDIFCVADGKRWARSGDGRRVPEGCLHPQRILDQVVAGVRDYGNRMGIPTVNGLVWYDDDYVGNPLVFCGCVGVMPRDKVAGDPRPGDRIIALGGRTGRDGIHGATFSSAELTDTHADEFSHAVQIGNAVTEKTMLDAILVARDHESGCLFSAITDCGAGGFSSAVGEMGEQLGADVNLDSAPLKYDGLSPTEIWISEAQERMVLAVPAENVAALEAICDRYEVEMCDLGVFGTEGRDLILRFAGTEVGRLPMDFLHDGLPKTTRQATWTPTPRPPQTAMGHAPRLSDALLTLLAHPNIASKHRIIRQYDHEVQGRSVVRPVVGDGGRGPSDAAVVRPVQSSDRGLAIGCGLSTGWRDDPYVMAIAAVDECVRNLVAVGADPSRVAILDNFCWPSCADPATLGGLVRAAEGCRDAALAFRTPFISGKDSLNNQFATEDGQTIRIPPTLLISGFGIVPEGIGGVTSDLKTPGNVVLLVGSTSGAMGGSHYEMVFGAGGLDESLPRVDLDAAPRAAAALHRVIRAGCARSIHDCSDGGLLVAAAEMSIGGGLGLEIDFALAPDLDRAGVLALAFGESPTRWLVEVRKDDVAKVAELLADTPHAIVAEVVAEPRINVHGHDVFLDVETLARTWRNED